MKREFAESLQSTWKPRTNPCDDDGTFEVTPVQRFVSNWMSPKTPYQSALLYHGVGVGKTCAAIQIAEAWLEQYPAQQVIIICPATIAKGFIRTIFDLSKVVIGEENEPNTATQCTGTTYMRLTNTLFERDRERIGRLVTRMINRRYKIQGYIAFANEVAKLTAHIPAGLDEDRRQELVRQTLRKEFSHRLLIVDEAHNLRDATAVDGRGPEEFAGGKDEEDDTAAGKKLTPFLKSVLYSAEGLKFCAMTATPMYNSYKEIVFLLNLLLMNDKKATLVETDLFGAEGRLTEAGVARLQHIAQHYVSFMRGENPMSFPVRLFPNNVPRLEEYPTYNPRGGEVPVEELYYPLEDGEGFYTRLPLVAIPLQGDALRASEALISELPADDAGVGVGTLLLGQLVQAGNLVYPATAATAGETSEAYRRRTNKDAWQGLFQKDMTSGRLRYRPLLPATWLAVGPDTLGHYSPKFDFLIRRLQTAEGCAFVYTRFIGGGALPLALALEANGYTLWGRGENAGLLIGGPQVPGGRQCALCPHKEAEHAAAGDHVFQPAYYGLLTGDTGLSPRNDLTIQAQRAIENKDGVRMKVIIGSQVASEGVDLRFVRETHVIDSWYHLNKTEQILGRAIRYLSHCALPVEKRNNTVYLYAACFPEESDFYEMETADLYSYRLGFRKAAESGRITRILKQSAIDCNLNRQAIVIAGEAPQRHVDSQRQERAAVDINDMPFTAICDWVETCDYTCSPLIDVREGPVDDSTYDEFSARWRMEQIRRGLQRAFERQPFLTSEDFRRLFADVPRFVLAELLREIVDNRTFQVVHGGQKGYIRYCNGYYVFQPNIYLDLTLPLSIRVGRFPVKRDVYFPVEYEVPDLEPIQRIDTTGTVESFWLGVVQWVEQLAREPWEGAYPEEIESRRWLMSQGNKDEETRYTHMLDMVMWFNGAFHSTGRAQEDGAAFRRALLFFFWDVWLRVDEHQFLLYQSPLGQDPQWGVIECVQENMARVGRYLVHRMYRPDIDRVIYLCEEGTECPASIKEEVERNRGDRMNGFSIVPSTTGAIYGFMIMKNGELIFKTGQPLASGKVDKGLECANTSNKSGHISKLIQMGEWLEESGRTDMLLNANMLLLDKDTIVQGSIRICTLLQLALRYLDAIQLQGKVWFFRPVFSSLTGHVGMVRRGRV
jgi:hypothetical protein